MRVLSAVTYYHPHWTGLTAHVRRLAEGLAARGHEVAVLAYQHDRSLPEHEMLNGVAVHRVAPLARISRGMISPGYAAAAARLARDSDVVLINTPMFEALPIGAAARTAGRPAVIVHHGDLLMPAGVANRMVEHLTKASMVAAARLASRLTTYSDDYGANSDFLLPFRDKVVAISPPVEIPIPDRGAAAAWRARLGLRDAKVIGFAGRFVEEKGGDVLLRALPRVLAVEPNARLVFAGEQNVVYESFFAQCRPLFDAVADRVVMLGLILDRELLAQFYAFCDVLALPSRSDCFALVQAEAMLCGTPVVASDIPGAREPILRTGMGLLVPPEDPIALADALIAILRGDAATPALVRAEVEKAFDRGDAVSRYETLLRDVIDRTPIAESTAVAVRTAPLLAGWNDRDRAVLEPLLDAETDMAYRRRLPALLEYLDLRDGDRVLDGGCGYGGGLHAMAALRDVVAVGIDRDLARVRRAAADVRAAVLGADADALPFRDATFDKALLSEVLEHVDDDIAVLREVARVVRPGGVIAISVPHADYPWIWDPINRLWHAAGGRPLRGAQPAGIWSLHRRLYWPLDLVQRVDAAGLIVERVESATHYAWPFSHFLVYGIGKPLFERRLLPTAWLVAGDRTRAGTARQSRLDPLRWARTVLRAVDSLNERPRAATARTFVSVIVKARIPAATESAGLRADRSPS